MMASPISKFEIHLEHDIDEQYQYEPGESLRGDVILVTKEVIHLKTITVQIKGEATVGWEDESGRGNTIRADENYVNASVDLVSSGSGVMTIKPGHHSYPLEYQLPTNLPSSFIGKFGSITYVAKATLKEDKRFGLSTTITSEPFLVLRTLDINKEPKLMLKRQEKVEERYFGIIFCMNGTISAEITVDKTGHLPGEDMQIDAEIVNGSPRTVQSVQASLIMHSTFHARNLSRSHIQVVNKKRDEYEMAHGDGRRWKKVRLTIPPYIPESRLDGCDIIDIKYELDFRIELSKKREMRLSIPITVGTFDSSNMDEDGKTNRVVENPNMDGGFTGANIVMDNPQDTNGVGDSTDGAIDHGDMDDFELDMNDEDHTKFRHPMNPGDIRKNPLFAAVSDAAE